MDPADIRRWARDHEAAAGRERRWAREHRLSPSESLASALALLVLDESIHGSPFRRVDPVSLREDAQVREAWAKLRARWSSGR